MKTNYRSALYLESTQDSRWDRVEAIFSLLLILCLLAGLAIFGAGFNPSRTTAAPAAVASAAASPSPALL